MPKYTNIKVKSASNIFHGEENGVPFSACFDLFLIKQAWKKGCSFEDLADGFGKGNGTYGGDWSGIRDSSPEAMNAMFEKSLNFLLGE